MTTYTYKLVMDGYEINILSDALNTYIATFGQKIVAGEQYDSFALEKALKIKNRLFSDMDEQSTYTRSDD